MIDDATTDPIAVTQEDSSILDSLRRRRAQLGESRTEDMDVPGYGGMLVVRVRPVEWKEIKKISERAAKSKDELGLLYGHCDIIIRATEQVMVRTDGVVKPIISGETIGWDDRLADLMGVEAKRARDVLRGVFNNDLAVSSFQDDLVNWMREANADVDEEFQGESNGTPR